MKAITLTILTFLIMWSTSWANEYFVDGAAGNDSNSGTSSSPWQSISKANSILTAGDIVFVRAGTYKTTIRPKNSGSQGKYITYATDGNDEVIITGVDGADLTYRSYITIDGFKFLNVDYFVNFKPNGHHNIIQNCHMEEGTHYAGLRMIDGASYNKILNNTLIGKCEPHDLISLRNSEYNLFDGNKLYYGVHDGIDIQDLNDSSTKYNIFRNNYIENKYHSNVDIWGVEYLLFDNNIIVDGGDDYKNNICGTDRDRTMARNEHKGIMTNTKYSIVRRNILVNNGAGIALASSADSWKGPCYNNRYYHNTIVKNYEGIRVDGDPSATKNVLTNNIVYKNINYAIRKYGSTELENSYSNNNILGASVSYGSNDTVKNTSSTDPMFVDEEKRNFNLQENSPMIDSGAFLTTTINSGTGTVIQVADARNFIDGWGIVEGDLIQLEKQTQTARITKINYSTNTITVNATLSWNSGQGLSLAYQGSSPDIGALEYSSEPPPPPPPPDPDPDKNISHCCLYLEAEDMSLISPMVKGDDTNASGGQFIQVTEGTSSFSPVPEATFQFTLPETNIYYLWIAMNGERGGNHALYVGVDDTWDRVYPTNHGVYEWVKVEVSHGSGAYGFNLSAGSHTLRVAHGEINAKADALYLSNDPNKAPARLTSPVITP